MSSKSKGRTAMAHARALCERLWPEAPVLEAQPRVVWMLDRKHRPAPGEKPRRIPMNVYEDFFGAFDLIAFHFTRPHGHPEVSLVQVTSWSGKNPSANASARRRKVRDNFLDRFPGAREHPSVWVWAWESRKYFHVWKWDPEQQGWVEQGQMDAPLPKKAKPTPLLDAADPGSCPF